MGQRKGSWFSWRSGGGQGVRGWSCIPVSSLISLTLMRSQSILPSTLLLPGLADGMWVKCLEIPKAEAPTLLPLPSQLPPHLQSFLFSFFSPLLFPSHLHTHTHTHTTHTHAHPKGDATCDVRFLLPKGCLLFRHLSWGGPSEENPFMISLMGDGVHRTSL